MEQEKLIRTIKRHIRPYNVVYPVSSYGLKHLFEILGGGYISNDEFKQAMILAGFEPTAQTKNDINPLYKVMIVDATTS